MKAHPSLFTLRHEHLHKQQLAEINDRAAISVWQECVFPRVHEGCYNPYLLLFETNLLLVSNGGIHTLLAGMQKNAFCTVQSGRAYESGEL